jgi:hypothetical protein
LPILSAFEVEGCAVNGVPSVSSSESIRMPPCPASSDVNGEASIASAGLAATRLVSAGGVKDMAANGLGKVNSSRKRTSELMTVEMVVTSPPPYHARTIDRCWSLTPYTCSRIAICPPLHVTHPLF